MIIKSTQSNPFKTGRESNPIVLFRNRNNPLAICHSSCNGSQVPKSSHPSLPLIARYPISLPSVWVQQALSELLCTMLQPIFRQACRSLQCKFSLPRPRVSALIQQQLCIQTYLLRQRNERNERSTLAMMCQVTISNKPVTVQQPRSSGCSAVKWS